MADINISVALTGLEGVSAGLNQMRSGFSAMAAPIQKASATFIAFRNTLALGATGVLIKETSDLADQYVMLNARVGIVASSHADLATRMTDIYNIAQSTRTPLDAIGTTYQRIAINSQRLGLTTGQVSAITETLAKAMIEAGATAQEAAGGMTQLTQALSKGKLDGDELRSVFENMPIVVKAMEEATGRTRGELYKLASQGKITAEVLVGTLLKAGLEVNEAFEKMPRTTAQAAQQLQNAFEQMVGGIALQAGEPLEGFNKALDSLRAIITDPQFQTAMTNFLTFIAETSAKAAGAFSFLFGGGTDERRLQAMRNQMAGLTDLADKLADQTPGSGGRTRALLQNIIGAPSDVQVVLDLMNQLSKAIDDLDNKIAERNFGRTGHPDPTNKMAQAYRNATEAAKQFNTTIDDGSDKLTKQQILMEDMAQEWSWVEGTTVQIEGMDHALSDVEKRLTDVEEAARKAAISTVDAWENARSPLQRYRDELELIQDRLNQNMITAQEAGRESGIAAGQMAEAWTGVGTSLEELRQLTTSVVSSFSSTMATMLVEGTKSWQDFFVSLEKMILQFLISQAIKGLLALFLNILLPGSGTAGGFLAGLLGFSGGGMVGGAGGIVGGGGGFNSNTAGMSFDPSTGLWSDLAAFGPVSTFAKGGHVDATPTAAPAPIVRLSTGGMVVMPAPVKFDSGGTVKPPKPVMPVLLGRGGTPGPTINFGTDTVPAMLTPGEFVVNKAATKRHRALLEAINGRRYANGGRVGRYDDWADMMPGGNVTTINVSAASIDQIGFQKFARRMNAEIEKGNRRRAGRVARSRAISVFGHG